MDAESTARAKNVAQLEFKPFGITYELNGIYLYLMGLLAVQVGHMEIDVGGTTLMISDEFPEYGMKGPQPGDSSPMSVHLHVENAERLVQRAVDAGATREMEPQEMQRRYTAMMQTS